LTEDEWKSFPANDLYAVLKFIYLNHLSDSSKKNDYIIHFNSILTYFLDKKETINFAKLEDNILYKACLDNDVTYVESMLRSGFFVQVSECLAIALEKNNKEIVELILDFAIQ